MIETQDQQDLRGLGFARVRRPHWGPGPRRRRSATQLLLLAVSAISLAACSNVAQINESAMMLNSAAAADAARPPRLPLVNPTRTEYRLGPKDLLEIDVFELEEPNKTKQIKVRVAQTGTILLPLIGAIQAVGLTAAELQTSITKKLARDFIVNPSVNVLIAEFKSRRVTVLGEVRYPGSFDLTQNSTTLVNALALAGGPTNKSGKRLFVLRGSVPRPKQLPATAPPEGTFVDGGKAADRSQQAAQLKDALDRNLLQIDLVDLVENGNMGLNCVLQDGDIIHVPKAELCFVTGMVHYPGGFPMREKITLLRALALAGGMRDNATPELTVLIRMTEAGRKTIEIDLNEVRAGSDSDLELRPGDVLVLNESSGSKVRRGFLEFFRGIFSVGYAVR